MKTPKILTARNSEAEMKVVLLAAHFFEPIYMPFRACDNQKRIRQGQGAFLNFSFLLHEPITISAQ